MSKIFWHVACVLFVVATCAAAAQTAQDVATLKAKAESGDAKAQCALGAEYEYGIQLKRDFAQAAVWFQKSAEQDDAEAEGRLGVLYRRGVGVPQNDTKAFFWLQKAAEQGVDGAQLNLAQMYSDGDGIPRDYAKAAFWFRKAAEQGLVKAERRFANSLMSGNGVAQNVSEAMAWYQKAASQGDMRSQYSLGQFYENGGPLKLVRSPNGRNSLVIIPGDSIPKDFVKAAIWYQKAAEQGFALAQNSLGRLYENGQGVPQSYSEAYFWLSLGEAGNSTSTTNGVDDRDLTASHLTSAELSRIQRRATKWFEEHPLPTTITPVNTIPILNQP